MAKTPLTSKVDREADDWISRLAPTSTHQSDAIVELGELLKRRVARAFRTNAKVDGAFVDDVVQDSLTAILNSIEQFSGNSRFETWATTIAVRTALRETRRLRWKDTSLDQIMSQSSQVVEPTSTNDDPAGIATASELVATMHRLINEKLTEKQRQVVLAHLRGMPQAEIGRELGMNRNAIYKVGFDARKKLKDELIGAGFSSADLSGLES